MLEWTYAHHLSASAEGWDLFETEYGLEIQRIDDVDMFATDRDAIRFVGLRADQGSSLHMTAIVLDSGRRG